MQHTLTKLMLGAFFALACVGNSQASSPSPPSEESVPLVREMLDGPIPNDEFSVNTTAAAMSQLGFADDAHLLVRYAKRTAFLHLLNRQYTPAATVREALKAEAAFTDSLDQLNADFEREGYSVQADAAVEREGPDRRMAEFGWGTSDVKLLPLRPGLWGAFDPRVTHSAGHSINDAYYLFVLMQVRNQTVEPGRFDLRIPVGGGAPMDCKFGSVAPNDTGAIYCPVNMVGAEQGKDHIIATITGMLSDGHAVMASAYIFRPDNFPYGVRSAISRPLVSPEDWFGAAAVDAAQHMIANAGCEKLGTCGGVFKGYMVNGGVFGMVVTAIIMIWTLYLRWCGEFGQGRVFSRLFGIYLVLVVLAGFLFYIDPPIHGTLTRYYAGLFSGIAAAILSVPWSFFMSALKNAAPYRAVRDLSEHDFAWQWFFIGVNLTYLGLLAWLRRARR
ncbi:hypothetical protein [Dyella flagellata]|uniref:Uncharacterized protein n=1 Tax=Dyella flagellata TaxID=1867833 RepID=A0ABQ5X7S4_9GAMM|nr:hypothetical protein [Dyella flagellata]GLQ87659.1 hypothetical protein GCM10007898_12250 [Dyella flagellata]